MGSIYGQAALYGPNDDSFSIAAPCQFLYTSENERVMRDDEVGLITNGLIQDGFCDINTKQRTAGLLSGTPSLESRVIIRFLE